MTEDVTDPKTKRQRKAERAAARKEAERKAAARKRLKTRLITGGVIVGLLAIVVVIAVALGAGADRTLGVPAASVDDTAPLAPGVEPGQADPAIGEVAPDVQGYDPEGNEIRMGPSRGTPQAIAFNAHWCPACQAEVPEVAGWVEEGALADGVDLIAVSTRHDPTRTNWPPDEWLEEEGWPGEVLVDADEDVANAYGLTATPSWVFLDADGVVVARQTGMINAAGLAEFSSMAAAGS